MIRQQKLIYISRSAKARFAREALRRSRPGKPVSANTIYVEALQQYAEKHGWRIAVAVAR